jgi:hypothetical protein
VNPTPGALLSYEGFDYPSGDSVVGKNGGSGFSQAWQLNSSGGVFTNRGASLSYTDAQGNRLVTTGGSLFLQGAMVDAANSAAAQPNRSLSYARGTNAGAIDGVTTWVSLLAVRQGPITNFFPGDVYPRSANMSLYNNTTEKLGIGNTTPANGAASNVVTILPGGINPRASAIPYSQTNLIVVRIDHVAGAALDNAYLFVNPPLGSAPALTDAATNSIGEFDFSFNRIRPFAGGDRSTASSSPYAELILDEIRIGETFADVTPFIPPLSIRRINNSAILSWPGNATLQSASNVTGAYAPIPGATSPYTNNSSDPARFYRLSLLP